MAEVEITPAALGQLEQIHLPILEMFFDGLCDGRGLLIDFATHGMSKFAARRRCALGTVLFLVLRWCHDCG